MASRKSYLFLGAGEKLEPIVLNDQFEFDEVQVWNTSEINPSETKKLISNPILHRKPIRKSTSPVGPKSLPVNVPDWSKILRDEYKNHSTTCEDDCEEDEDDEGKDRIPPHEYLARTRVASFSVHEGVGRTLKGRDMSRVRNAIWKKIGFED